ncbi:unnamed protein product [Danaus chrysippus]|uniref:(African queen) hypothetical protein n=1 Tax=Danaus chrysippus TaxID=151541 RepID=A0A8J2QNF5_9NEOP|nr:unnamed protein product [Danaus chrysippus]
MPTRITIENQYEPMVMVSETTTFPVEDESNLIHANAESFHLLNPIYTYCSQEVSSLPSLRVPGAGEVGPRRPPWRSLSRSKRSRGSKRPAGR